MESILNAFPSIRETISVRNSEAPGSHVVEETDSGDVGFSFGVLAVEAPQNRVTDKTGLTDAGFSFGIPAGDDHDKTSDLTADEIFRQGRIVPLCSLPNNAPSSRDVTDTDEIVVVPKTAPGSPIKSWSTGSTRKADTIRELLFKGRSLSDGKEKLGFLKKESSTVSNKTKKNKKKEKEKKKRKDLTTNANKTDYADNSEKVIITKPKANDALTRRRPLLAYIGLIGTGLQSFTKKLFF